MNCPSCSKEVLADRLFCTWCDTYIPAPTIGKKASVVRRWFAELADFIVVGIVFAVFLALSAAAGASPEGGSAAAATAILVAATAYLILAFWLFTRGMTPGKWLLGEQVVEKLTGRHPGFLRMLLREIVGKFLSSLFFGLGYFWALFDKDNQAWHDKLAGTVVVKRMKEPHPAPGSLATS